jgi:hypothetical protein
VQLENGNTVGVAYRFLQTLMQHINTVAYTSSSNISTHRSCRNSHASLSHHLN